MKNLKLLLTVIWIILCIPSLIFSQASRYQYRIATEGSGSKSYIFTDKEKPKLNLCENDICDVSTVNAVLSFLKLPNVSTGVPDRESITGHRWHRGTYYWKDYPLGPLTVERDLCGHGENKYDCILKIRIDKPIKK